TVWTTILRSDQEAVRSPVAVPLVVFDDAFAHRLVRRFLVAAKDGRPDRDPPRVGAVTVGFVDDLPRHFGDVLGMHARRLARRRTQLQWRTLCFPELTVIYVAKIMHPSQHVKLAGLGPARIRDRVVRGG